MNAKQLPPHRNSIAVNYNLGGNVKHYRRTGKNAQFSRLNSASSAARNRVMALIKSMAPRYGVPTWFALRIAKVESGYNPRARGRAGEIGVFQLKCSTARGLGYRGGCGGLYNAGANVQYGLKHLSIAIRSSRGNLKLAASKHNGGLGRKHVVPKYVRMVF
jgi:soluble lytic murein transglycosylase-like protein